MISSISFVGLPKINFKGGTENLHPSPLERTPSRDSVNFNSDKGDIRTKVFEFKMADGSPFTGTVKEFLEASVLRRNETKYASSMYHVPSTTDVGKIILKEGLDWTKNSRSQAGPGTYFSPSAAAGEFSGLGYNSIEANYAGNKKTYPVMQKGFYDRLCEAAPISRAQYRDIMMNELDADFLYSGTGRAGGAYVVLNDNCMSLSKYGNW